MSGNDRASSPLWQRVVLFILTATFGAIGVFLYLTQREKQAAHGKPSALAPRPVSTLAPAPPRPKTIQLTALPLKVTAAPRTFKRRQPGTIRAETAPGADCTISAKYSTGRPPTGLEPLNTKADRNGIAEWTWDIGTGGSHVEVVVRATSSGNVPAESTLRVSIVD